MATIVYIIVALLLVTGACLAVGAGIWYFRYRGKRLVTCPETGQCAAVEVDAMDAAVSAVLGAPTLHLSECTRWPERGDCGQVCLRQIEVAPQDCLVRNIAERWYADKSCALCHRPIGPVHWHDHRPALLDSQNRTVQWNEVPAESLPEFLLRHSPICWNCHVVQRFVREHGDLVTHRPEH